MPRQDIQIDTDYGELETTDNIIGKMNYDFVLLDSVPGADNDNYCYGEVVIPMNFEKRVKDGFETHISIPYKPIFKQLRVRFRVDMNNDLSEFIRNASDNELWYDVALPDGGAIRLAEFRAINEQNYFNLRLEGGRLSLYSGKETDLLIKASLSQNQNFLLRASAGTLYQHPLTGVGLIDFLHGNFENSGLAAKLQKEFEADNMIVVNAYMNSETGELLLEVREKNG